MNYQRVVILKEKMADRYLPIWIGPSEADAIAVKLQGLEDQAVLAAIARVRRGGSGVDRPVKEERRQYH